jgi:ubiquitin-activating enzyme E1-like protein
MPTNYTGDSTAAYASLTATVTGATNASPIVIQTSAPNNFNTGDTVVVANVNGNTAANGQYVITVVDTTHFSLNGSSGSGTYTSGGTADDISLGPAFQIPSDGDTRNASSVNVALEALANRSQLLATLLRSVGFTVTTFTVSGTYTTGPGARFVIGIGCGGGGGGGGSSFENAVNSFAGGGAGGGGGQLSVQFGVVTGNTAYTVAIGAGGLGGAGAVINGTQGQSGTAGGDTNFGFGPLMSFVGGGGGQGGGSASTSNWGGFSFGGSPVVHQSIATGGNPNGYVVFPSSAVATGTPIVLPPGNGGWGLINNYGSFPPLIVNGVDAITGGLGGAAGPSDGTDAGSYKGGGRGGGGGGGGAGPGAQGGAGGNAASSGSGVIGGPGSPAFANTGGGGGGAGAPGAGPSTSLGAGGGNGGTGILYVIEIRTS